jgi:hypothetical protein
LGQADALAPVFAGLLSASAALREDSFKAILPTPLFAFERVTINPLGDKRYFAIDLTDVRAMADQ